MNYNIQQQWQAILEKLKKDKNPLYELLKDSGIAEDGDNLKLYIPNEDNKKIAQGKIPKIQAKLPIDWQKKRLNIVVGELPVQIQNSSIRKPINQPNFRSISLPAIDKQKIPQSPLQKLNNFLKFDFDKNNNELVQGALETAATADKTCESLYQQLTDKTRKLADQTITVKFPWRLRVGGMRGFRELLLPVFHPVYGVPYIPSSSLKGAIKAIALQNKSNLSEVERLLGTLDHGIGCVQILDAFPTAPSLSVDMANPQWHNMAILLANLGTSDLAIKINDFDYCLPIFERKEPNEDTSKLSTYELDAWNDRDTYTKFLYDELNIRLIKSKNTGEQAGEVESSFIEFSHKLLKAYLSDPDTWHHHIRPGRIGGVIIDAQKKFELQKIHLFVTNQNPQHKLDTIYLFEILKHWFKHEYNLILTAQEIPFGVTAKEADKLLNFYYQFFTEHISNDSTLLVSIKGGTPQMQTALKMQAIASSVSRLMFIDPQFDIGKTLAGKFSECELTSYWRYMRTQKYQTVKLLLEENHWDFNGSIQILKDWQVVLKFFINHQVVETNDIANSNEAISRMIKTLDIGINSFNLDIDSAQKFLDTNSQLKLSKNLISQVSNYDMVLNLYTQCRIYWKLNQVANFLSRMSSFYEAVLVKLARNMGFYSNFPLKNNRFDKREFVDNQINLQSINQRIEDWQKVLFLLKSLDFWCEQRNDIIHLAKGISKLRMEELYNQQRQYNSDVCDPKLILNNMAKILSNDLEIVRNEYRNKFVGDNQEYYIYSEVKNWVIETLDSNGLRQKVN